MDWNLYEFIFKLKSPLHIGFHKVLIFSKTRYYAPGKLIWAGLTSKVTPLFGITNYETVGQFFKESMRYGYFYLCVDEILYIPKYTEEGLKFGPLSQNEFEKRFITSIASTAIQPESLTAEEGMLHEIEIINPYTIDNGKPVYLKCLVWVKNKSKNGLNIEPKENEINISYNDKQVNFNKGFQIQIGGERRYGFGLIELVELKKIPDLKSADFPGTWREDKGEVVISITKNNPIWAHTKSTANLNINGDIEPLVGRDWDSEKGAGRILKSEGLFWMPGSILIEDKEFRVIDSGWWELV